MKRSISTLLIFVAVTCVGMGALFVVVRGQTTAKPDATVLYSQPSGEKLFLDVYKPDEKSSNHLAIILVHGGGWAAGDKTDMSDFARALTTKGFTCFSVQYRFASKYLWPAQLDDVQTAVRFIRAQSSQYRIDKDRIGAVGGSAGGHLVQCLGVRETRNPKATDYSKESSRVQAVWNIFGPTDLTQSYPTASKEIVKKFLGELTTERLRDASPIFFVDARSAPTFFLQGKQDELVPWTQAESMANKLKAAKIPVVLNLIENMKHDADMKNPQVARAIEEGVAWLYATLRRPSIGQPHRPQ